MAEQHVRALQHLRSNFDHIDYAIMEVICCDVGRKDEPARTSLRNIALRAGCHYNTVASRIEALAERGYLEPQRQGKFTYYAIHLDGVEEPAAGASEEPARPTAVTKQIEDGLTAIRQDLAEVSTKSELAEVNATLKRLSQRLSQIVTMLERRDVTEDREDKSPPTPPYSANGSAGEGGGDGEEKPGIVELAEYFCQAVGRNMPRQFGSDYARDLWWEPLAEIYNQHGNMRDTKRAIYAARQYATEHGLVVATPKSLLNLATAGTKDRSGYRDRNGVIVVSGR